MITTLYILSLISALLGSYVFFKTAYRYFNDHTLRKRDFISEYLLAAVFWGLTFMILYGVGAAG